MRKAKGGQKIRGALRSAHEPFVSPDPPLRSFRLFEQSLTAFAYNATDVAAYGSTSAGHAGENSAFAGGGLLPAPDVYFTIALVLTGGNNWRLNINGVDVSNLSATGTEMQAFQSLAFGRLKNSHGIAAMTFDTVQLYDTSLTASEIAAIPEPASLALLLGAAGWLAAARRGVRS